MNTLKGFVSVLLITVSAACGNSGADDSTVSPATTGTLTAQVDGQSFTATQPVSTYEKATKRLTVTAGNTVHQLGFTLVNFSSAATVPLADAIAGSSGSYIDVKTNTTYALKEGRTGTVTVTKFDGKTLEGTFSMKTYNTQLKREIVVSNGAFKVPVVTL